MNSDSAEMVLSACAKGGTLAIIRIIKILVANKRIAATFTNDPSARPVVHRVRAKHGLARDQRNSMCVYGHLVDNTAQHSSTTGASLATLTLSRHLSRVYAQRSLVSVRIYRSCKLLKGGRHPTHRCRCCHRNCLKANSVTLQLRLICFLQSCQSGEAKSHSRVCQTVLARSCLQHSISPQRTC